MKTVLITILMILFSFGTAYAGKNPKLLKEIKRKVFLDLSKVQLEKDKEEFVIVKFRVTNQQIEVIDIKGSQDELTEMMIKELQDMVIRTDAEDATTYQYKFKFEKE
ncbi:MAG: hypothetical protein COA32_08080 [Fluviicola sp.]|nr:MAG: hypothetical protein COA32_08080 [Fluviicola sp.]